MKRMILILSLVLACAGCARINAHLVEKPRVDQQIPGMPLTAPVKTRQILEINVVEKEKAPRLTGTVSSERNSRDLPTEELPAPVTAPAAAVAPQTTATAPVPTVKAYKVEKDDTLQKISRKIYGSYGKWTRIYDANKNVIKDPNFLKPGTTLTIPSDQ